MQWAREDVIKGLPSRGYPSISDRPALSNNNPAAACLNPLIFYCFIDQSSFSKSSMGSSKGVN